MRFIRLTLGLPPFLPIKSHKVQKAFKNNDFYVISVQQGTKKFLDIRGQLWGHTKKQVFKRSFKSNKL